MKSYTLAPRLPRRAPLTGGVLVVMGVILALMARALNWPSFIVVFGLVAAAFGVGVLLLTWNALSRYAVHVEISDSGYRILGPSLDKQGDWDDVSKVALTPDGSHMVIKHGSVRRNHLIAPRGGQDPQMLALIADVSDRLSRHAA